MKKSKLFLSILALCFSLAVLTFGVFAANQVNYTISGNISYVVSDAYVEVETKIYQSDAFPQTKQDLAVLAQEVGTTGAIDGSHVNCLENTTLNTLNQSFSNPYEPASSNPDVDFNDTFQINNAGTAYNLRSVYIIAKITNLAVNNVYAVPSVTLKDSGVAIDAATYNVVEYMSNGYSEIDQNETVYIKLAYSLSDITQNIGSLTFDFAINIHSGDYPDSAKNSNLEWDETNNFWFVKMGTKTISTNTYDLRWRLYSIDGGATKYVDSEEYPIGRGVFVLEDAKVQNGTTIGNCLIGNTGTNNQYVKFNENYINDGGEYYRSSDGSTKAEVSGKNVLANDYFGSYMYEYLNTTYLGNTGANISTDSGTLYNSIISRTQADLCQDMVAAGDVGGENDWLFDCEGISNGSSAVTRPAQKLWLLSYREALTIICGDEGVIWNPQEDNPYTAGVWEAGTGSGVNYWLRSPDADDSGHEFRVYDYGNCNSYSVNDDYVAVRAAFQLAL